MADLTGLFPANGDFYFQAFDELVSRPIAGYNYGSYWTTLPVGLSPTRAAASFAAPDPDEQISPSGSSRQRPRYINRMNDANGGVTAKTEVGGQSEPRALPA